MEWKCVKMFLFVLLCFFYGNSFSQSCISIKYDNNGNRTQMEISRCGIEKVIVEKEILKNNMIRGEMSDDEYYEYDEDIVAVYPNPNNGIINIETNSDDRDMLSQYEIYNIKGLLIDNGDFFNSIIISIENHPDGVYLLKIISGDNVSCRVIVKL